jgi:hypothetical protein
VDLALLALVAGSTYVTARTCSRCFSRYPAPGKSLSIAVIVPLAS